MLFNKASTLCMGLGSVVSLESTLAFHNRRQRDRIKRKENDWSCTSGHRPEVMKLSSSWPHGYSHGNDRLLWSIQAHSEQSSCYQNVNLDQVGLDWARSSNKIIRASLEPLKNKKPTRKNYTPLYLSVDLSFTAPQQQKDSPLWCETLTSPYTFPN